MGDKYNNKKYWMEKVYNLPAEDLFVQRRCKPIVDKIHEVIKIKKVDKVLEVGCGAGNFTIHLNKLSNNVIGIDNSDYVKRKNPHKNVKVCDARSLPFKNNSFDMVCCFNTLHHIPSFEKAIKEMIRVSKKFVIFHEPNTYNPFMIYAALSRKEERMMITKRWRMKPFIKDYLQDLNVVHGGYITNHLFTNALPPKVLALIHDPLFHSFPLGTEWMVIGRKG